MAWIDEIWEEVKPDAMEFMARLAEEVDRQLEGRVTIGHPVEERKNNPPRWLLKMSAKRMRRPVEIVFQMSPDATYEYTLNTELYAIDYSRTKDGFTFRVEQSYHHETPRDVKWHLEQWTKWLPQNASTVAKVIQLARTYKGARDWFPSKPEKD